MKNIKRHGHTSKPKCLQARGVHSETHVFSMRIPWKWDRHDVVWERERRWIRIKNPFLQTSTFCSCRGSYSENFCIGLPWRNTGQHNANDVPRKHDAVSWDDERPPVCQHDANIISTNFATDREAQRYRLRRPSVTPSEFGCVGVLFSSS